MALHQSAALIRPMQEADIERALHNFAEQGWAKPREVLEAYLSGQEEGSLFIFVAQLDNDMAGYTVLYPEAAAGPFAKQKIPIISDFNVLQKYQRRGIGNGILDAAEQKASALSDQVHLGVGLHSGYGAAQKIYIKRGYRPDGSGVWYQDAPLEPYADCKNDDDLVLYLLKDLK